MKAILLLILFTFTVCSRVNQLRMDERSVFLRNFLKSFFPDTDPEDYEQLITCAGDYESLGYNAAQGTYKYQLGYTYAEKIIALSYIGMELKQLSMALQKC